MAKEFIGYGLVKKYFGDVVPIGITSEKRGQVYGRYLDNDHVAHWGRFDILYRFPEGTTAEFAKEAATRTAAERALHTAGIEKARGRLRELEIARDEAVTAAAKGIGRFSPTPPPAPPAEVSGCYPGGR